MKTYTLKGLVILTAFVALLLAYLINRTRLAETEKELSELRKAYHLLDNSKPEMIRAISVPSSESLLMWRWRIALPHDVAFDLKLSTENIPKTGQPNKSQVLAGNVSDFEESILSICVDHENDKIAGIIELRSLDGSHILKTETLLNSSENLIGILESFPTWKAGEYETQFGSPNEVFVLLHSRRKIVDSQGYESTDPNPTAGLLIWLEPKAD